MNTRAIHRSLAWVAGLVAVLWAATGFLHPILSWSAPRPAVQAPPSAAVSLVGVAAPPAMLPAQSRLLRLVEHDGRRYWQTMTPTGVTAVDAETGEVASELPAQRAIVLARHYAGLAPGVAATATKIERFSTQYPQVNKLLPVYEVRFATPDGLALYVEPGADRLAMTTNDQRRVLLAVFQNIHTLKFLEGVEPLRLAVITAFVGSVLVTTLFGIAMLVGARGRGMRLWHRTIGWTAAPVALTFTISGLFHLFATTSLTQMAAPTAAAFNVSRVAAMPRIEGISRADVSIGADGNGSPLWRVLPEGASSAIYFDAEGRALAIDDATRARKLARAPDDASIVDVTRFGADYGFINKRLPVVRVGEGAGARFVDLREGLVAASAASGVRAYEGWFFDTIHKWEPVADAIGRRNRDYLTMAAVALIAVMASFGLVLAASRRKRGEVL
jgi:hypothetical protein